MQVPDIDALNLAIVHVNILRLEEEFCILKVLGISKSRFFFELYINIVLGYESKAMLNYNHILNMGRN